ncbi:MAG: hypothetical protein AB7T63_13025 [Planctomycetota bacterium]
MRTGVEAHVARGIALGTLVVSFLALFASTSGCGGSGGGDDGTLQPGGDATFVVVDRAGLPVAGATVHVVPTSGVDKRSISAAQVLSGDAEDRDEPLEDAVRLRGATFPQAVTDADGRAVVPDIPPGRYFWLVVPAPGDLEHLPGGTEGRFARDHYLFVGQETQLVLSGNPSPASTYIGSSTCLICHDEQAVAARHAHRIGLVKPGQPTAHQDLSLHPMFTAGWAPFVDAVVPEGGTAIWFSDRDPLRGQDVFLTSPDDPSPGGTPWLRAWLWRDLGDGKRKITLDNLVNPADPRNGAPRFTLEVELTYGGAVGRQVYLVRVPGRKGHYPLGQYHLTGSDARYDWTRRRFRDLDLSLFFDEGAQLLRDPAPDATFEARCAGCHFTGYEGYADVGGERLARAVRDPSGVLDLEGDGFLDEINVGCESCHGRGQEHAAWAAHPANAAHAARFIVSPGALSPSRQLMLCGRCHERVVGQGTVPSQAPLDANDRMPPAGLSRAEFLASYVSVKGPAPTDLWSDGIHARFDHQQASELVRSPKARNDRILVTCQDCHDNHGESTALHHLLYDHTDPLSLLCFRCHNVDHLQHMQDRTGSTHAGIGTVCSRCHMPATGRGGAGTPGFPLGPLTGTAADEHLLYWRGDRTSHLFAPLPRTTNPDVAGETPMRAMPIPYTDACGTSCHDPSGLPFLPKPDGELLRAPRAR